MRFYRYVKYRPRAENDVLQSTGTENIAHDKLPTFQEVIFIANARVQSIAFQRTVKQSTVPMIVAGMHPCFGKRYSLFVSDTGKHCNSLTLSLMMTTQKVFVDCVDQRSDCTKRAV